MIIVQDIQDAMMMQKKLGSIIRRSVNSNKTLKDVQVELLMLVEDLGKNIERLDAEIDKEIEAQWTLIEKHNKVEASMKNWLFATLSTTMSFIVVVALIAYYMN